MTRAGRVRPADSDRATVRRLGRGAGVALTRRAMRGRTRRRARTGVERVTVPDPRTALRRRTSVADPCCADGTATGERLGGQVLPAGPGTAHLAGGLLPVVQPQDASLSSAVVPRL